MKKDKSKDLELIDTLVNKQISQLKLSELIIKEKEKRSDKLWKKLVKELDVLQDNNYTARILFDYVEKHYS
jgi:hypothetical protein